MVLEAVEVNERGGEMKSLSKALVGVALLSVTGAASLRADFKSFGTMCSPGAVKTCVSMYMYTTNFGGNTQVRLFVRNAQGAAPWIPDNTGGSILRRLGIVAPTTGGLLNNSLGIITHGAFHFGNPGSLWGVRTGGGIGGPIEVTAGVSTNNNGGIEGCNNPLVQVGNRYRTCGNQWVEFTFSTVNAWSANNAEVAFITASYANGTLGQECDSGQPAPGSGRFYCGMVTPEPISMLLLGSGLAGVGGMGIIRRRKQNENDVTSD